MKFNQHLFCPHNAKNKCYLFIYTVMSSSCSQLNVIAVKYFYFTINLNRKWHAKVNKGAKLQQKAYSDNYQ